MRKVSIKVQLKKSSEILKVMHDSGKIFSDEYQQFDRVFVPRGHEQFYPDAALIPQLLIRTNTIDKQISHTMILKRPVSKNMTYFFQTQIMDYNQTAHIINNMGYELTAEVAKNRRKLVIGSIIIYLDQINEKYYLKIEKNLRNDETDNVDELWDLLTSFNLTTVQEEVGRYSDIVSKRK
ncbi:MAG: hypothetical protein Q3996_01760 [Candidatus Saccharibacteria bacterium]|nr:hypothetical protein [Candidatus Saccharibacteria bacterium]